MSRVLRRFRRTSWLIGLVVLATPAGARADDVCSAESWWSAKKMAGEALKLSGAHRFDEALARVREAWKTCPHPQLHGVFGRIHQEAGRPDEALTEYRLCASSVESEDARTSCRQRAAAIESEIASRTAVVIDGVPAGALVFVDGETEPRASDAPIPLVPGNHLIEVRNGDQVLFQESVTLAAGRQSHVRLVQPVAAEPAPSVVPEVVAAPAPSAPTAVEPQPAMVATTVRAAAFAPQTRWNWVGLGASALAVGVGVTFLVQYGVDRSNAQDRRWDPALGGWWDADEVGVRNLAIGASLTAVGLAGGILSAVLWPKVPVRAAAAPANGGGVLGVAIDWR